MDLTTFGARKLLGSAVFGFLATTLLGCPTDPERRDSGSRRDSGPMAALGTCEAPRSFTVTPGLPLTVTGDTTDGPAGPLNLGACGEQVATSRAPQDVLAIRVGGTGERAIRMSLRQTGTELSFDTLLQSRGACTTAPERDRCFDNVGTDVRSEGGVMVNGGDTLFVIVTGADNDSAPYELLVESTTNAAPTLTSASFQRIADTSSEIVVSGADPDANPQGIGFQLLDASGTPISVAAAGAPADVGPFFVPFEPSISSATFNNVLLVGEGSMFAPPIGAAVRARIFINDFFGSRSAPMDVTISDVSIVPAGAACDATRRCAVPNTCTGGTCTAPAGAAALCGAATNVSLMTPVDGVARVVSASAMIPAGPGVLGGCRSAAGGEVAFNVTVPAGAFDLTARTLNDGTADTLDTVVYVRSSCTDTMSERACGDDDFDDVRSNMQFNNATAGTYTVVVGSRIALSTAAPVQVDFRLRPLRAVSESCDARRIDNRCDTMDGCTGSSPGEEGNVCAP